MWIVEWWRSCRHKPASAVRERSALIREGANMYSRSERECACGILIVETHQESRAIVAVKNHSHSDEP